MKTKYIFIILIGMTFSTFGQSAKLKTADKKYERYSYIDAIEIYEKVAEKAYQGLLKTFVTSNNDGTINLNQSCRSAGLGPAKDPSRDGSASYYLCGKDVTIVSNEGKAIGPFIMASLEYELKK